MENKDSVIQPPENQTGLASAAQQTQTKPKAKVKVKKRRARSDKGVTRPRATAQTALEKAETPLMTSIQRRDAAHANNARPERVPMAANYEKLGSIAKIYEREGYHLRMFRDEPGRIDQALRAHYVFVLDEQGNQITYRKGLRTMILMELPNKLWEEEKALLEAKTSDIVKAKQEVGKGQYIPDGKSQPLTRSGFTDPTAYDEQ